MAFRELQSSLRRNGAPVTITIIALAVAVFIVSFVAQAAQITSYLAFSPSLFTIHPWSIITYPFAADVFSAGFIGLLFSCWWMYGIGGSVERDLGPSKFIIFWLAMTILPALFIWLGTALFLHTEIPLVFMFLPIAGVTVAWGTRNPNATILFMMVIPLQAKWVAWITAGLVFFGYGAGAPPLAVFSCLHLLVAYAYASNKIPGLSYGANVFTRKREGWKPTERDDKFLEAVKNRERERAERERLRKLFEGSISEDPEDKR